MPVPWSRLSHTYKDRTLASAAAAVRPQPSWPWWRWLLVGLITLGLALSSYLSWHYLVGRSVIGCAPGSSCDQVLGSRWSTIGGVVPVSGLAEGVYLALLVASFFIGPGTEAPVRRLAWRALLVLTAAAAGSAVWFTIVQKWLIGAFCPYCMTTHLIGLMLVILVVWLTPRQGEDGSVAGPSVAAPSRLVAPRPATGLVLIGLSLAGILAAAQIVYTPAAAFRDGNTEAEPLAAINPHAVPLIGSPDAPVIVAFLFDYKCPHCQPVHAILDEAVRRSGGRLAFVLCPVPLNTQCNPYVPRDVDAFKDSCELAKIALAVWVAKHEAFPAFDHWMNSPEPGQPWHPRTLEEARAQAVALVGEAAFTAARANPWIDRYLQTSIRIFGDTGASAVPKLVFGRRWVTPEPNNVDDLLLILHSSLAVPQS